MAFKNFYKTPQKRESFTFKPKEDDFHKKLGQKYLHRIYLKLKKILPKEHFEIRYNGKKDYVTGLYFSFKKHTFIVFYFPVKESFGKLSWHPAISLKGYEKYHAVLLDQLINNPKKLLRFLNDFIEA